MSNEKGSVDDRSSQWSLVLDNPVDNPTLLSCDYILSELRGIYNFVAVILHDDDYNEKGVKERNHYHVIIEGKRTRKETLIKQVGKILKIPTNVISSREVINFRKAVRYITHCDYEDKTLYLPTDIKTNDHTYLMSFFSAKVENICEEKIIQIVREKKTTSRILLEIGYSEYKKWNQIIRDLQKEII